MKNLEWSLEHARYKVREVNEIIKCKSPDNNLCIAEAFSKALLENTSAIICVWDLDGTLIKFNKFGQKITGYLESEVIGKKWLKNLINQDGIEKTLPIFEQFKTGIVPDNHETPIFAKNGTRIDVLWTNCIIFDKSNNPHLGVSIGTDITDKRKAEEKIRRIALYDHITGLPNRTMILSELNRFLKAGCKDDNRLAVIFIDLDNFKMINDTYGHVMGDELLRNVGGLIRKYAGEDRLAARLGGDEFIMIIPEITSRREALELSDNICSKLRNPFYVKDKGIFITASIGVAIYPNDGRDSQVLLKSADIALSNAKSNGKNQIKAYEPRMEEDFIEKLEIENDLRKAIINKEFLIYYQPQVDISTGKIVGMESLLRWNHPKKGLIPPDKFIPIAEESGLIYDIGNWVLRTACIQNKEWHDKGYNKIKFSVNISSKQFEKTEFIERVYKKINDTGIDPKYIELEITETIAVKDFEYTVDTIKKLREMNISVALDDFGKGYSSLNYLNKLPLDKLKIDKSFLDDIKPGSTEEYIAKAIIGLARHMNLTVVAEGVETMEQIVFLKKQNCENVQGYYFSKPLPPQEFEQLLKNQIRFTI